jgi:endonuclease/exonuclease/phosphatase (EEP) superfamily protein YafD
MTQLRRCGRVAYVVVAVLLVVVSFLPLWWTDHWWVRLWDFPKLQVAGLLIVLGLLLWRVGLGLWRWPIGAAILAALAWQVSHFLAYFPGYPKQVESTANCSADRQISLLNANVLMTNRNYSELLRIVEQRNPDVVLLLETDKPWARAVEPLRSRYPLQLSEPIPNTYGLILMSRLAMEGRILHRLQPGVPSADVLLTLRDGSKVRLQALHPEPPLPGDDSGERDAELVMVGREVRDEGRATIVLGDLNDVAWSRTSKLFRKVAGTGDPRVGRGLYPTFNARYPLLRWPLDHMFLSPHFELMQIDVLADIGSDHFPIFFKLCLKSDPAERKVAPSAPSPVEAEATEEVQAGKEERQDERDGR